MLDKTGGSKQIYPLPETAPSPDDSQVAQPVAPRPVVIYAIGGGVALAAA